MEHERRIIRSTGLYSLERLRGCVDGAPFEAFLLRMRKDRVRLGLAASSTPPKKLSRYISAGEAFAGINGGFFSSDMRPLDWLVLDGLVLGSLSNPRRPCLYLENGSARIGSPPAGLAAEALPPHESVLQAGPLLLHDSIIQADYSDFSEKASDFHSDITAGRHPRSIFGLSEEHFCFLAVIGRTFRSRGLFLHEAAALALAAGMRDAINLDGGASSTLIVEGCRMTKPRLDLINKPYWFLCPPLLTGEMNIPSAILAYAK
jgi:exopolysaccharide biosynthesis protein